MIRSLSVFALLLSTTPTFAQQIVGRTLIDGQEVVLLDNGKWRYSETTESDCNFVATNVTFCGEDRGWTRTIEASPEVTATYRHDDRHYGQIIVEELGSLDGLTAKFMRGAVIENAAATTGRQASDIVVIENFPSDINGVEARTVVYQFDIDGLEVVYANGIVTSERRTMQVMTFSINTTFTDQHRELHDEFLSHFQISQ